MCSNTLWRVIQCRHANATPAMPYMYPAQNKTGKNRAQNGAITMTHEVGTLLCTPENSEKTRFNLLPHNLSDQRSQLFCHPWTQRMTPRSTSVPPPASNKCHSLQNQERVRACHTTGLARLHKAFVDSQLLAGTTSFVATDSSVCSLYERDWCLLPVSSGTQRICQQQPHLIPMPMTTLPGPATDHSVVMFWR